MKNDNPLLNMKVDTSLATDIAAPTDEIMTVYEKRKMRKAALLKMLAMLLFVLIVLVFSSIAWFTMSKNVSGSGMGAKVNAPYFEIASTGSASDKYLSLFNTADNTYHSGSQVNNSTKYQSDGRSRLIWRLDSSKDDGKSYTDGFRPGASGTLSFDIIPNTNEEFYVDCKFDIRTFVATYADDDDEKTTPTRMDEVDSSTGSTDEKSGYRYLNGHILFFENKFTVGDNNEHTIYSGYIGSDGLKVHIPENSSGETVTVYWKWVNTFDQFFLKSTDSFDDYPLFADTNTSDRTKAINYIKSQYRNILADISSENETLISSIDYNYVKGHPDFLSELSENYNTADQIIGLNIDFFLLEMSAEKGNAPVSND